jgi:short-subunit dehydrogenase
MSNATRGNAIAILGATSAIGKEIADVLGSRGRNLLLFARNEAECAAHAASLVDRYGIVAVIQKLDVSSFDEEILRVDLISQGPLGGVILCVGYLGDLVGVCSGSLGADHAKKGNAVFRY